MDYLRDRRCASLWSLRRTGDYFGAAFLYDLLPNEIYPYDYDAFRAYAGTFYAVVTDCETGAAEYRPVRDMRSDIVYVRASSSLPLLSRMVEADGRRYLDGGIADSIPLRRAEADGREKNVVVLTRARDYRKGKNRAMFAIRRRRDYPRLVEAAETRHLRYNETLELIRGGRRGRAFVIAPTAPVKIGRLERTGTGSGRCTGRDTATRRALCPRCGVFLRIAERFSLLGPESTGQARYPVLFHPQI